MIYRKKIVLALIELFGGELSATDFQKLLFLFSVNQNERKYDFVPYKFGCFSFQSLADKNSLVAEGYLENSKNFKLVGNNANNLNQLNEPDRKQMTLLKKKFSNHTTSDLIKYVYLNYPYFAINSEIINKYLTEQEIKVIEKIRPNDLQENLFTIGYEGRSLEEYLNILIQKNIKMLCDVRKNPISRKYGFSKKTLENACEAVNIRYIHIPELGIISEKRKTLNCQNDYDSLFLEYEQTTIQNQKKEIRLIYDFLKNYGRVALTCFESTPIQCHRNIVAKEVHKLDESIPIKHL